MPTHRYKYSIDKIKYKFRNPFANILHTNNIKVEEEKEEDVMMNSDNEVQEPIDPYSPKFRELEGVFMKLRKNAKRRLELLIRKHSNDINSLETNEKEDLLEAISQRFYKMSLKDN